MCCIVFYTCEYNFSVLRFTFCAGVSESYQFGRYLPNESAQVLSFKQNGASSARPESNVMILGSLKDQMSALRDYSRPAIKYAT